MHRLQLPGQHAQEGRFARTARAHHADHLAPGHAEGYSVEPGLVGIEAMAQVGGIYVLRTVPDPENYITYFLKIENTRFRHKVVPGDTLLFRLRLLSPIRRGICEMEGKAYVGNKLVMEGHLLAQIIKK